MQTEYAIIGAGQAGIPLAHALAEAGHSTVLIEGTHLGGSCVNFGCTPSKAVIASARLAHQARRASDFGLKIPTVKVDFPEVLRQARKMSSDSRAALGRSFEKSPHLTLVHGMARLNGRDLHGRFQIEIAGEKTVFAKKLILNLGTHSSIPSIVGLDRSHIITAENWLNQKKLPKSLVILGSGYIGVEMAQFYRRMGAEVSVIEPGNQILAHEDRDVAEALEGFLEKEGVHFHKKTSVKKIERTKSGWKVFSGSRAIVATDIFVAAGRSPNSKGVGLETIGVELDEKGYVKCDSRLATNVENVWVAGDLRGGLCFTHTSWDDFRILKSYFLEDGERTLKRIVPYAVFSDPELGRVGMSEKEAVEKFPGARIGRFKFADNGKATEIRESEGFIKLIAHPEKDELLGAVVLGAHASETVQLYVTLMNAKAPFTVIRDAIYIHPTLAEAAQSVVSEIPCKAKSRKAAA